MMRLVFKKKPNMMFEEHLPDQLHWKYVKLSQLNYFLCLV